MPAARHTTSVTSVPSSDVSGVPKATTFHLCPKLKPPEPMPLLPRYVIETPKYRSWNKTHTAMHSSSPSKLLPIIMMSYPSSAYSQAASLPSLISLPHPRSRPTNQGICTVEQHLTRSNPQVPIKKRLHPPQNPFWRLPFCQNCQDRSRDAHGATKDRHLQEASIMIQQRAIDGRADQNRKSSN